jgi:bifunctional non-homologous end joining protein LigD
MLHSSPLSIDVESPTARHTAPARSPTTVDFIVEEPGERPGDTLFVIICGSRSHYCPDRGRKPAEQGEVELANTLAGRFVVQKHRARTLHYDFRLERDGVFKSWAVPKGVPEEVGTRHLAIQVADHPLEYGSFEGTIPEGEYGAGTVEIWDEGNYDLVEWSDEAIGFVLHGTRLNGKYALVRFSRKGPRDWLILRRGR